MNNHLFMLLVPSLFMLLHLLGLVLAVVFWKRSPAACSLLLLAVVLNSISTVNRAGLQIMLLEGQIQREVFGWAMSGLSVVSWVGYAVMIVAVVVGRARPITPPRRRRPEPDDESNQPPHASAHGAPSTGIQDY